MGKLNNEQRKTVGEYCQSAARKNNNKKQIVVYTSSNDAGLKVKGAISAAYPSYKFYKAENRALNTTGQVLLGIFTLGAGNAVQGFSQTWKNFTVQTPSSTDAENLVKEIDACIAQYGSGLSYTGSDGGVYDVTTTGTGASTSKDWITYLVIGAALVAIILLLWKRKK